MKLSALNALFNEIQTVSSDQLNATLSAIAADLISRLDSVDVPAKTTPKRREPRKESR